MVTIADPINITDMISAAVVSSFLALRIRPVGSAGVSVVALDQWHGVGVLLDLKQPRVEAGSVRLLGSSRPAA